MASFYRRTYGVWAIGCAIGLSACSAIPTSGPSRSQVSQAASDHNSAGIQIVDLTDSVARQLFAERKLGDFSDVLGDGMQFSQRLGVGDTLSVLIWEAPPATLFSAGDLSSGDSGPKSSSGGARMTTLPMQTVDGEGNIRVPFVGAVKAAGLSPTQLGQVIATRLKGMAHDPQVMVKLDRNETSYATVVGDVSNSTRVQLSARGERVLDALASAGGVKQPVDKITIQVTRGNTVASLPLSTVIRDPRQNVPLRAGDVVTALFQPFSFISLGATGKNQEISFEAQGITLAQALARSGGLEDSRADAQGVFIFRFESAGALDWQSTPVRTTADNKVPVIYRVNLRDPNSFFVAQNFIIDNKDLIYVSNSPVSELQKILNLVFTVAYPVVTGVQSFK
ncbi:polysaccharide biosynthesis/export family protein [Burkholderia gladioli]|uniref:polysaccharide biosynthesis/export family protein n=1 Tax=Burkholderia gladioli TaxID=28095 RepID=UPI0016408C4A|nr:polysaccharide biosynthesis/export family protein [Burkholderia gladioli]URV25512.1 polysaccharide export protein [Burkholderia gladioli]